METSFFDLSFERIDPEEAAELESPFSEAEIFEALNDLNGEKAPGPNGFPMAFWQFAWDVVKKDVLRFFKEFYDSGRFVKSMSATFLVLIPKKGGAKELKDIRPICLVEGIYKWMEKVMANRLKKVLLKVISKAQNAFVEGRQILDAILVANEAIDSILKSSRGAFVCKLDLEKAYDHVDWSFLRSVMSVYNGLIHWCISTAGFSVIVNGSPHGFSIVLGA